jgi:peptide/nickel transport system ATP-binding protein
VSALNPLLTVERQLGRAARLCGQSGSRERLGQQLLRYQLPADHPGQLSAPALRRHGQAHSGLHCGAWRCPLHSGGRDHRLARRGLACQLLGQLRELANQGSGILWVTHDLALAARFADRIVALHQGR